MAARDVDKVVCPRCSAELGAGEKACHRCGAPIGLLPPPVTAETVPERENLQTVAGQSRRAVLLLLFVVLGPLAIGILWKSHRFSRSWKAVLTVLVLIQFAAVIWILWYAVSLGLEYLEPLWQSQRALGN